MPGNGAAKYTYDQEWNYDDGTFSYSWNDEGKVIDNKNNTITHGTSTETWSDPSGYYSATTDYRHHLGQKSQDDYHLSGSSKGTVSYGTPEAGDVSVDYSTHYSSNRNHSNFHSSLDETSNGEEFSYDRHYSANKNGYNEIVIVGTDGDKDVIHTNTHGDWA